jgi:hypothetical protein
VNKERTFKLPLDPLNLPFEVGDLIEFMHRSQSDLSDGSPFTMESHMVGIYLGMGDPRFGEKGEKCNLRILRYELKNELASHTYKHTHDYFNPTASGEGSITILSKAKPEEKEEQEE